MIIDHNAMGTAAQLKVPKVEPPGERNFSPKSVLCQSPIHLSSSASEEESPSSSESASSSDSEASSSHSDRSDSEVDYEVESESDEEDQGDDSRPPRAKKQKITTRTERSEEQRSLKKKSRTKTTAKRADCYALKQRTSNPGRRVVGGRIYDSELGRTCHWCRQKTVELHVECWLCPIRYCGQCLLNRNGEIIMEEMSKNVRWICPKCRGGCGPGCKNCCNCGPCRKAQNFEPTGQAIQVARRAGFSNVHDYLVHLETQEDAEVIAKRKEGRGWTKATGALVVRSDNDKEDHDVKQEDDDDDEDVKQEDTKDGDDEDVKQEVDEDDEHNNSPEAIKRMRGSAGPGQFKGRSYPRRPDKSCTAAKDIDTERVQGSSKSNGGVGIRVKDEPEDQKCSTVYEKSERIGSRRVTRNNSRLPEAQVECTEDVDGNDFATKLEITLQRPFSTLQLKQMLELVNLRKTVTKLRQTRNRAIEVPCGTDGLSYLDHYPDFEEKLAKTTLPDEKLKLLRGFFFWLQHSCMEGAFRPWAPAKVEDVNDSGECMEINGPDCQIIKVLLAIDEDEKHDPLNCEDKKPVIRGKAKNAQPRKEDTPKPYMVKVKLEKEDTPKPVMVKVKLEKED